MIIGVVIREKIGQHEELDARHLSVIDAGLMVPSYSILTSLYAIIYTIYVPLIES
jgi:hypothetical protein